MRIAPPTEDVVCSSCATPFQSHITETVAKCPGCGLPYKDQESALGRFIASFLAYTPPTPKHRPETWMMEFFKSSCRTAAEVGNLKEKIKADGPEYLKGLLAESRWELDRKKKMAEGLKKEAEGPRIAGNIRAMEKLLRSNEEGISRISGLIQDKTLESCYAIIDEAARAAAEGIVPRG